MQRKQEVKEAELASRRQELEALRRMKDREAGMKELYARCGCYLLSLHGRRLIELKWLASATIVCGRHAPGPHIPIWLVDDPCQWFALRRQRREQVQQREAERQQQVAARTQAKMERARSLELQRASLKAALDQLRRDIAQQEEEFKARLADMQVGKCRAEMVLFMGDGEGRWGWQGAGAQLIVMLYLRG